MGGSWSEPDALVSISHPRLNMEAGKRVILCAVHLKMQQKTQHAPPPCLMPHASNDEVECEEQESPGPETKVYHIFYYAEKTGRRTLQIYFDGLRVEIDRGSPIIEIDVLPSSPCSLKEAIVLSAQSMPGSVHYRDGELRFYVVPYDKFGNTYNRGNLKMHLRAEDDSIKLISSEVVGNEGMYSVRAQCLKVGKTKGMISFQGITTPLVCRFKVPYCTLPHLLGDGYDGPQSKLYKRRRRRYCAKHNSTGGPLTGACNSYILRLEGCDAGYVIGPEHTRLNNINRVLGVESITDSDIGRAEENDELCTDCYGIPCCCCPCCRNENLKKFEPDHACDVKECVVDEKSTLDIDLHRLGYEDEVDKAEDLLDLLLKARHYRRLAGELDEKRLHWKNRATSAYESGLRHEAKICSDTKKEFGARMNKSNRRACDAIFAFYNENLSQSEIDLHELYVSDEEKLKNLRNPLVKQMGECGASQVIARIRESGDEAIRKLQERLNTFDHDKAINDGTPWLEIIVGAGKHSRDNRQKIRPKVENFLRNQDLPAHQLLRKGSLLITFREYTGQQPCFGHFYCERCDNSWRSMSTWVGKYQCCYRCFEESNWMEECYPMMLQKRGQSSTNKASPQKSSYIPTHRELQKLCQRCRELGRYCSNA